MPQKQKYPLFFPHALVLLLKIWCLRYQQCKWSFGFINILTFGGIVANFMTIPIIFSCTVYLKLISKG